MLMLLVKIEYNSMLRMMSNTEHANAKAWVPELVVLVVL